VECKDVIAYLSDYIDRNLSDELAADIRDHIATCRNCHVVLDSTQQTILLYRERGRQVGLPPARHTTLFNQLATALAGRDDDCEPVENSL
jgi:hypothetical protein